MPKSKEQHSCLEIARLSDGAPLTLRCQSRVRTCVHALAGAHAHMSRAGALCPARMAYTVMAQEPCARPRWPIPSHGAGAMCPAQMACTVMQLWRRSLVPDPNDPNKNHDDYQVCARAVRCGAVRHRVCVRACVRACMCVRAEKFLPNDSDHTHRLSRTHVNVYSYGLYSYGYPGLT